MNNTNINNTIEEKEESEKKKKRNKELSIQHLKYLFGPYPDDILSQLNYDYISKYSITPAGLADKTTEILRMYCQKIFDKSIDKLVITEMTACVGGNGTADEGANGGHGGDGHGRASEVHRTTVHFLP